MEIVLIYASTSGNVEIVMESVSELLLSRGWQPTLMRAEQTKVEVFNQHQNFILGTSTWEHGRLNPFFEPLLQEMKTQDFHGKQAAFIGLGDRRYEPVLFCEGMEILRKRWLEQGGAEIGTALKIQGEPYDQLDTIVKPWANSLVDTWTQHA